MEELAVKTSSRQEFRDISSLVQAEVSKHPDARLCVVYVPHTTAGVTINENADPDVKRDMLMGLERIVDDGWPFRHGEGNSPAHIKTALVGSSICIPVERGRLRLGTWQAIYLAEFDGPRSRRVLIQTL